MEFYPEHSLSDNYAIAFNKIFMKGFKFKNKFSEKFKLCPNGLTMSCNTDGDEIKGFYVTVKKYGYESMSNNGTEYTDLSDYETNFGAEEKLTPEMKEFCVEYLKTVDEELYDTVKKYWNK